jgi:coenzyme F420-reducing hydrogenase delta subunit
MTWVSAAEGRKFADVVEEVTKEIKKLGPMTKFRRKNAWQTIETS